ncbi:MAG: hypothetical protein AAFU56_07090 [Pseudomonadota bacterium]
MLRFGTKSFPDTLQEYIDDRGDFYLLLRRMLKHEMATENLDFVEAVDRKANLHSIYSHFIMGGPGDDSPFSRPGKRHKISFGTTINVAGTLLQDMRDLAMNQDWRWSAWEEHLTDAYNDCYTMLEYGTVLNTLHRSPEYVQLMERHMFPAANGIGRRFAVNAGLDAVPGLITERAWTDFYKYAKGARVLKSHGNPVGPGMEATAVLVHDRLKELFGITQDFRTLSDIAHNT